MPHYIAVPGTWGEDDAWWRPESAWSVWMEEHGWFAHRPDDPFMWSCDLDGALIDRLTGRKHRDWQAAGAALSYYLEGVEFANRIVIAHSHGGQAVAYCAAEHSHVVIRAAITVCTPVRGDMRPIWAQGKAQCGVKRLVHLWAPGWKNRMQWLGGLFDGRLGFQGALPCADTNLVLPTGAGHSGVLADRRYMPAFRDALCACL